MTVLQIDREAAADLMEKLFTGVEGLESDLDWANTVRAGEDDEYPTVPAFAAHREQATAELVEALRECLPIPPSLGGGPVYQRARLALIKATGDAN